MVRSEVRRPECAPSTQLCAANQGLGRWRVRGLIDQQVYLNQSSESPQVPGEKTCRRHLTLTSWLHCHIVNTVVG